MLIGLTLLQAPAAQAANLVQNGGFETGTFAGWTAIKDPLLASETQPWAVAATGSPGGGGAFLVPVLTDPVEGEFSAFNGFEGSEGLGYTLYQDVLIPAASLATLTTNHRIVFERFGLTGTADRTFEISVRSTSNALLRSLFLQQIDLDGTAGVFDLGWKQGVFDLSDYAGQTVRIHFGQFVPDNFTGPAHFELDAISLEVTPVPEPGTWALLAAGLAGVILTARSRRRAAA
jgi:hypothetical protein